MLAPREEMLIAQTIELSRDTIFSFF